MRVDIKFWLSILPFSMMLLFLLPLMLLIDTIGEEFFESTGLIYWFFLFLLSGWACGWQINKVIARYCFKWPRHKMNKIFSHSEIPHDWFKTNGLLNYHQTIKETVQEASNKKNRKPIIAAVKSAFFSYMVICFYAVVINPFLEGQTIDAWHVFLWPGPKYGVIIGFITLVGIHWSQKENQKMKMFIESTSYFSSNYELKNSEVPLTEIGLFHKLLLLINLLLGITLTFATFALAGLLFYLAYFDQSKKLPTINQLANHTGIVSSFEKDDEYIKFELADDHRAFKYPTSFGAIDIVFDSLSNAADKLIEIRIKEEKSEKIEGVRIYLVYEIKIDQKFVRSFKQIELNRFIWQFVYVIFGMLLLVGGVFMAIGTIILFKEE